ncbi:hypothetical protein P7C70_g5119, partial [Phenoliferia sp. Uapishka_3]
MTQHNDPWQAYFDPLDEALAGTGLEFDNPVSGGDGTARCRPHFLEICGRCELNHMHMREELRSWRNEKDKTDRRKTAYEQAKQHGVQARDTSCSDVCDKKAALRCSACRVSVSLHASGASADSRRSLKRYCLKFKQYCSAKHQKAAWPSHRAACKQLSTQLNANCKLLAILTGTFNLRKAGSGRDVTNDLGNLTHRAHYRITWTYDGKSGDADIEWLGYQPPDLLLADQPPTADARCSPSFTHEVSCWEVIQSCKPLRGGRVHTLANLVPGNVPMTLIRPTTGDSAFFSLAINFRHFGTCLPWAPTVLIPEGDYEEDETPSERRERKAQEKRHYEIYVSSGNINKMPGISSGARETWDPNFKRLQVRRFLSIYT